MNLFNLLGKVTINVVMLFINAVKALGKRLAALTDRKAALQALERKIAPIQAEGRPEKLTPQPPPKNHFLHSNGDLLAKFNKSAAAAPQRSPSVSAGALTNQLPSARLIAELLKKDGWDSIDTYFHPESNKYRVQLINKTENKAKVLTLQDFLEELRKRGFKV